MKRVLSLILVLALVLAMVPAAFAAETIVLDSGKASAGAGAKKLIICTPTVSGTLTVTVGNGKTAWVSDIYTPDFNTTEAVMGQAEESYTHEVIGGQTYYVRIYGQGDPSAKISNVPYSITLTPTEEADDREVVQVGNGEVATTVEYTDLGGEAVPVYEPISYTCEAYGDLSVKITGITGTGAAAAMVTIEEVTTPTSVTTGGSTFPEPVTKGKTYAIHIYTVSSNGTAVAGTVSYELNLAVNEEQDDPVTAYEKSGTALAEGSNNLQMIANTNHTLYSLTATGAGTYIITGPAGSVVDNWGTTTNPADPSTGEDYVETNVLTWKATAAEQSIYVGVSGVAGGETFTVQVAFEPGEEIQEIEWVVYENTHTPDDNFALELGEDEALVDVDLNQVYTLVKEGDYYYIQNGNGNIPLYVNLNDGEVSLYNALNGAYSAGTIRGKFTDDEGTLIYYEFIEALREYVNAKDDNGVYPLTEDLMLILKTYGKDQGWYNKELSSFSAIKDQDFVEESAWMALCCYVGGEEEAGNKLVMGENKAITTSTSGEVVYNWSAPKDGKLTITAYPGDSDCEYFQILVYKNAEDTPAAEINEEETLAEITVSAGDKLKIMAAAQDYDYNVIEGSVVFDAAFECNEHSNTALQNVVTSSCTVNGYTGDEVCLDCGTIVVPGEVITASGHSYNADVTEPTFTEQGYTTYTCPACGDTYVGDYTSALAAAKIGETYYTDLSDALAAAKSGETVTMVADTQEGYVFITPGVTLDLADCTLTADYVIGLNGSYITATTEDTEGVGGKLVVKQDNIALDATAPVSEGDWKAIPVWNEGYYFFAKAQIFNPIFTKDTEEGTASLEFNPTFKAYVKQNIFNDGCEDNDVAIIVRVSYLQNGIQITREYYYTTSMVIAAMENHPLTVSMTGCGAYNNLEFSIAIVTDAGAEIAVSGFNY